MTSMESEFDFLDDPQHPSTHQFLPRSTSPYSISSDVSSAVDPFYTSNDEDVDNDPVDSQGQMTEGNDNTEDDFSHGNYDLDLAVAQELGRSDRWSEEVQHDLTTLAAWETRVKERAQELQLNHALLQHQAMIAKEQAGRVERDMLLLRLTEAEQDKLLLEAKLREVVSFEHGQSQPGQQKGSKSLSSLLKGIRGKLLDAANDKIDELSETIRRSDGETANDAQQWEQLLAERESEITALREETVRLSQQLAQRTVLFSAQDRRWRESTRSHLSLQTEQSRDLLNARARLQQLESVYERTDRERLEQHVRCVHLQEEVDELRAHLADESDRVNTLDSELTEAIRLNATLQSNVERLRGVDVVDLERELATELEDMRRASRDTELQLSRQLEEARERIAQEAEARSLLLEELQHLREMVASHQQYQHQYQHDPDVDRRFSTKEPAAVGETDSLMSLDQCEHDHHDDDLSRQGWVGHHLEDQGHNDNLTNAHHEFQAVIGEQMYSSSSAETIQAAATMTPTTGDVNNDDDDHDEEENQEDGGAERVDVEDVEWLRSEIKRLTEREATLVRALDQHKGKLALVLHRAALLSSPISAGDHATASMAATASATINQLRHTLAEKGKHIAAQQEHINVLVQQLDGYRVEVTLLEDQCQQSKEVGVLLGVAQCVQREERLRLQIEDLSSELLMLKDSAELQRQQQQAYEQGSVLLSPMIVVTETTDDTSKFGLVIPSSSVASDKVEVANSSSQTNDDCVLRMDAETTTGDDDVAVDVNVGDAESTPKPSHEQLLIRLQSLDEALAVQSVARQMDAAAAAQELEAETAVLRDELARSADDLAILHRANDQLSMRLADLVELRQHITASSSSDVTLMSADEEVSKDLETERAMRMRLQEQLEEANRTRVTLELEHEDKTSRLLKVVGQLQTTSLPQSLEQTAVNAQSEPSREAALVIEVAMLQQEVSRITTLLSKETAATVSSSQQTEIAECEVASPPVVDDMVTGAAAQEIAEMKEMLSLAQSQRVEALNEAKQLRDQMAALQQPPSPHKAIDDQQLQLERAESSEKALALVALRRQHKTEMKQYRRRISTRCRALIDRQKAQFVAEREQTVLLVRQECADIVAEAQILMQRNRERNQHHYRSFPSKVPRHSDFTPGGPMSPSPSPFYDPMAATVVSDASTSPEQERDQQQPTMMMSPTFDGRRPQ